jgi:hypothetical protein
MGTFFILLIAAYVFSFLFNIDIKDIFNTTIGSFNLSKNIIVKSFNYFKNHERQGLILGSTLIHILGFYLINQKSILTINNYN